MENSIQNMPADVRVLSVKQKKPYLTFNAFLVLPWEKKQDKKINGKYFQRDGAAASDWHFDHLSRSHHQSQERCNRGLVSKM